MIRFSCISCNHLLRAPALLAGKKGRCARCGAINPVPEALMVEVARTPAQSPFRSTADLELSGTIEGSVALDDAKFLATAPDSPPITEKTDDFFEEVTSRLNQVIEEIDSHDSTPSPLSAPVARVGVGQAALEKLASGETAHLLPSLPFDEPPSEIGRRAILGALVVGAVLGFCLGLLAARLL